MVCYLSLWHPHGKHFQHIKEKYPWSLPHIVTRILSWDSCKSNKFIIIDQIADVKDGL